MMVYARGSSRCDPLIAVLTQSVITLGSIYPETVFLVKPFLRIISKKTQFVRGAQDWTGHSLELLQMLRPGAGSRGF